MFVRHKILRPKGGTLACAGRRPAYMLVFINDNIFEIFIWSQKKKVNIRYSFRVKRNAERAFTYLPEEKKKPRKWVQ